MITIKINVILLIIVIIVNMLAHIFITSQSWLMVGIVGLRRSGVFSRRPTVVPSTSPQCVCLCPALRTCEKYVDLEKAITREAENYI